MTVALSMSTVRRMGGDGERGAGRLLDARRLSVKVLAFPLKKLLGTRVISGPCEGCSANGASRGDSDDNVRTSEEVVVVDVVVAVEMVVSKMEGIALLTGREVVVAEVVVVDTVLVVVVEMTGVDNERFGGDICCAKGPGTNVDAPEKDGEVEGRIMGEL